MILCDVKDVDTKDHATSQTLMLRTRCLAGVVTEENLHYLSTPLTKLLSCRFDILKTHKPLKATGAVPKFSTELAGVGKAWRMAFAAGRIANKNDRTVQEPITFNARDTIETADGVNATGNFAS
mmetsp:Transcript_63523/g.93073  ORF Transcript_63523/g.93073 Transcript_63523/m.93073 type:complete len:124 (+) Transcript_63523:41-412(+)